MVLLASKLAKNLGETELEFMALVKLGELYESLGARNEQMDAYYQALDLQSEITNDSLLVSLMNRLGQAHFISGSVDEAENCFVKSLALREKNGDFEEVELTYNNLGSILDGRERPMEAMDYYKKALVKAKKSGNQQAVDIIRGNMAVCMGGQQMYAKARSIFRSLIAGKKGSQDLLGLSGLYIRVGDSYQNEEKYDSALVALGHSLGFADSAKSDFLTQSIYTKMAKAHEAKGNYKQALKLSNLGASLKDYLYLKEKKAGQTLLEARFTAEEAFKINEERAIGLNLKDSERARRQEILIWASFIILILVIFSLAILYSRFRERQKQAKSLSRVVEEKTKELKETYHHLESEMKARIQTQEDLNTYIYRSSHDLKGPLTTIKGLIGLMKMENLSLEGGNYLAMICGKTEQLDVTLERLLQQVEVLSKPPEGHRFAWDRISASIKDMVEDMDGGAEVNFLVEGKAKEIICTDIAYLQLILRHLVMNAVDFREMNGQQSQVKVGVEVVGNTQISFVVKDNGIGIKDDVKAKIFQMFFRGHLRSKGNGLGLYIVEKCVRKLGGEVYVQSQEGIGTEVKVTLPQLEDVSDILPLSPASSHQKDGFWIKAESLQA